MQSSVRAVEAFRRSRLIDGASSDEDKITPVYRFEEICQVLRSSSLEVNREMLEHTLKRLDQKSPIVKQKTLRFMKYAATKGGPDFKRELQRQAGVVRSLTHYKGQLDALKGDALNKAVRDTAHETIAAIFGTEEKTTTMEDVGKRIQGFGSSNYDKPREEEKKSVFSGLVGLGSQSLKQSLEMIHNYNHYSGSGSGSNKSSFSGAYRSQGLRRSLTAERERFEKEEIESWNIRDAEADDVRPDMSPKGSPYSTSEVSNGRGVHNDGSRGVSTVEDRLLDSLTTPGGVRLQPTRETLQAFTTTAAKLDAANLVNALETKLRAHNWQVRFKALCLLEAAIRQRETKVLDSVTVMFEEDADAVVGCLQSPQASLRDKAKKVIGMLGGDGKDIHTEEGTESDKSSGAPKPHVADLPDLMDTRELDFGFDTDSSQSTIASKVEQSAPAATVVAPPVQPDFFGDWVDEPSASVPVKDSESDPFAGMSFHSSDNAAGNGTKPDLFSGLDVDNKRRANSTMEGSGRIDESNLFDGLSVSQGDNAAVSQDNLVDLLGNLSTNNGPPAGSQNVLEQLQSSPSTKHYVQRPVPAMSSSNFTNHVNHTKFFQAPQRQGSGVQPGVFPGSHVGLPQMYYYPPGSAQYANGLPAGIPGHFPTNSMLQQPSPPGAMNFTGMNTPFAQQQFAAHFAGVPRYVGGLQTTNGNGGGLNQGYSDNFDFSSDPVPRYTTGMENTKKEDTKAFDFISDHVSSQLGPKNR